MKPRLSPMNETEPAPDGASRPSDSSAAGWNVTRSDCPGQPVVVSTSVRSPARAPSNVPSDMNSSTGGPVSTLRCASCLSNQACSA
jgi:hypothetical protein